MAMTSAASHGASFSVTTTRMVTKQYTLVEALQAVANGEFSANEFHSQSKEEIRGELDRLSKKRHGRRFRDLATSQLKEVAREFARNLEGGYYDTPMPETLPALMDMVRDRKIAADDAWSVMADPLQEAVEKISVAATGQAFRSASADDQRDLLLTIWAAMQDGDRPAGTPHIGSQNGIPVRASSRPAVVAQSRSEARGNVSPASTIRVPRPEPPQPVFDRPRTSIGSSATSQRAAAVTTFFVWGTAGYSLLAMYQPVLGGWANDFGCGAGCVQNILFPATSSVILGTAVGFGVYRYCRASAGAALLAMFATIGLIVLGRYLLQQIVNIAWTLVTIGSTTGYYTVDVLYSIITGWIGTAALGWFGSRTAPVSTMPFLLTWIISRLVASCIELNLPSVTSSMPFLLAAAVGVSLGVLGFILSATGEKG